MSFSSPSLLFILLHDPYFDQCMDSGGTLKATNVPATNVHITAEFVLEDEHEETVPGD
jgi:hypothetical protein